MTTCNDIIRLAMSRLRQLRPGETPTASEAADGMTALQSIYDTWAGNGLFGRLYDTIPSGNYTAQEQDRVVNDGGYVITLPSTVTPSLPTGTYTPMWPDERIWSALQTSVARPPRDLALIEVIASGAVQRSLYDALSRAWIRLDGLALTGPAPLANRGAAGLASCLAEYMADEYGLAAPPGVVRQSMLFRWSLSSKYASARVAAMTDYF